MFGNVMDNMTNELLLLGALVVLCLPVLFLKIFISRKTEEMIGMHGKPPLRENRFVKYCVPLVSAFVCSSALGLALYFVRHRNVLNDWCLLAIIIFFMISFLVTESILSAVYYYRLKRFFGDANDSGRK